MTGNSSKFVAGDNNVGASGGCNAVTSCSYYSDNNDNFLWSRGRRSVDDFFFLLRENKIRKEKPKQSLWRGYEVKKGTGKKKSKQ